MNRGGPLIACLLVLVMALGIIGLAGYARGPQHHRGDEIGTHGTPPVLSR